MSALTPLPDGQFQPLLAEAAHRRYRLCKNSVDWDACNWLVPTEAGDSYCLSCDLNQTIPDLSDPENMAYWHTLEQGKRRLVYGLQRLRLPVTSKHKEPTRGLAFEFLREQVNGALPEEDDRVMTGHKDGVITVNVSEADDLERERIRVNLNEVYRSVLGHFRHESGHYYWQQLISGSDWLAEYRRLFGDERTDYKTSINNYYQYGPPANWADDYISAYASSHPWEDWAECWAHYLTIVDALETASNFGVSVSANRVQGLFPPVDSYGATTFSELLEQWLPLTYAINSINRSGGQKDLYPFVLSNKVIGKMEFIHEVARRSAVDQGPA